MKSGSGLPHSASVNWSLGALTDYVAIRKSALRMKTFRAAILAIIILALAAGAGRAEKIRTAIPQANLNYLSIHVADAKGFFREEGLDNETVVISGPLSIAALLSGDVDFSGREHQHEGHGGKDRSCSRHRRRSGRTCRMKKLQLGNATKPMLVEATKNYLRALAPGVPGLPTAEGIKNFLEYDIKIPMQIKDDIPPERQRHLQLVEEVKKELEAAQRR